MNAWKKIISGLVSYNCMFHYLSKNTLKSQLLHNSKKIWLILFQEHFRIALLMPNMATSAQANRESPVTHFFQANLRDNTCQMLILCNVEEKKIHCVLLNNVIPIFIMQEKVLL